MYTEGHCGEVSALAPYVGVSWFEERLNGRF